MRSSPSPFDATTPRRLAPWSGTPPLSVRLLWGMIGGQAVLIVAAVVLKGNRLADVGEVISAVAFACLFAVQRWRPKPFIVFATVAAFEFTIIVSTATTLQRLGFVWQLATLGFSGIVVLVLVLRLRALGWYSRSLTSRALEHAYPFQPADADRVKSVPLPAAAPSPLVARLASLLVAGDKHSQAQQPPPGIAEFVLRHASTWTLAVAFVAADGLSRDSIEALFAELINTELPMTRQAQPLWLPMPGNPSYTISASAAILCLVYEHGAPADAHAMTAQLKSGVFENVTGRTGTAISSQIVTWVLDVPMARVISNPFPPIAATLWPGPRKLVRLLGRARG